MQYNYDSLVSLGYLKDGQAKRLNDAVLKQVWDIDKFIDMVPDGSISSFRGHVVAFPQPVLPERGIGADPGVHLGLSFIEGGDTAHTLRIFIERAGLSSADLLSIFYNVPVLFNGNVSKITPVVVEGAAYDAKYGQPLLGEIRAALILGFHNAGFSSVVEMQPTQIRLKVFGSGSTQPLSIWKDFKGVEKDEADALSMAIAAGS